MRDMKRIAKTPESMPGAAFVAIEPLYQLQPDGGFLVVAEAGETCERVHPPSLTWLLEQGRIRPVKES